MDQGQQRIYTVSQLTRRIKGLLESEVGVVWVSGEISNWTRAASGHAYFTLKDEGSQLDMVMFRGRLSRLKFDLENGLEVLARGTVTVYERRGAYQMVVEELQPKGVGALQLAYEKLKKKLEAGGLFDEKHKKPLPLLPRRIGIVTSPTGAAIRDILHVIRRRFANVHIILYPARVQGDGAAEEIAAGIRALDAWGVDVMIVGRGGGSLEDLWPFNEECVCRAIFSASTPIISAVGHEIDFTLADFTADKRAPTPSAAAELVVREQRILLEQVALARRRLERAVAAMYDRARNRLERYQRSFVFQRPDQLLRQQRQLLDEMRLRLEQLMREQCAGRRQRLERAHRALGLLSPRNRLQQQMARLDTWRTRLLRVGPAIIERRRARYAPMVAQLGSLSPVAVLGRGYALVWKQPDGCLVKDAAQLKTDDEIRLWFAQGEATAAVKKIDATSGMKAYELEK